VHFVCLATTLLKDEERALHNPLFPVTMPNIYQFQFFTSRLSNTPCLIWLLKLPPHLKYVTTDPVINDKLQGTVDYCTLQFIVNYWISSRLPLFLPSVFHKVVQRRMWNVVGSLTNTHFAANLLENLTVKNYEYRLRLNRDTAVSLVSPRFGQEAQISPSDRPHNASCQ